MNMYILGRKKKAAPPPPKPLQNPTGSTMNLESPVVASQTPLSSASSKTGKSTHLEASNYNNSIVRGLGFGQGENCRKTKTCKDNFSASNKRFDFLSKFSISNLFSCASSKTNEKFEGTLTLGNIYRDDDDECDNDDTLTVIAQQSDDEDLSDKCNYQIIIHRGPNTDDEDSKSCSSYGSDLRLSVEKLDDDVFLDGNEVIYYAHLQSITDGASSRDSDNITHTFSGYQKPVKEFMVSQNHRETIESSGSSDLASLNRTYSEDINKDGSVDSEHLTDDEIEEFV